LCFLGYGTDVDTWNVRVSASAIRSGDYVISRPPGAPVHEAATALLDGIGGSLATNLASLVAGLVVVYAVASLLRRAHARHAELAALTVAANPYFIVSATSLSDALWALAFLLGGIEVAQRKRPWLAGALFALAIGCRMATGLLVVAYLLAEVVVRRRLERRTAIAGGVALVAGAALFIPAWLSVGRSADFLQNSFGSPTVSGLFGRWVLKQALFIGFPALIVLAIGWRSVLDAARRFTTESLVSFAFIGGALTSLLFFRLPWKFTHLLPVLVCVVLLYALAPRTRAGWFIALAACQLLWGFAALRTAVPDVRDQATRVKFDIALVNGALLSDIRCRIDDPGTPSPRTNEQQYDHALAMYRCTDDWAYGSNVDVPATP
jgi:hypothetical protein